jgi:parallel beta-helix repeat protein
MKVTFKYASILSTLLVVVVAGRGAFAEDISGTIAATKTIMDDSRLVGDVTCSVMNGPCIAFGASGIKLSLNGHTITGPANPDDSSTCNPGGDPGAPPADLIGSVGQTNVQILGPGLVQRARRNGIFIWGTAGVSTRATVKQVTLHNNCIGGILTDLMSDSIIEGNNLIRNGMNSGAALRGGYSLINSNNNLIRRSQFSGNGSVCPTPACTASNVTAGSNSDFGVGLLATSSGNLIETNSISGNTNGVLIVALAAGNVVRQNSIAGNPPSQISRDYGAIGFDIIDQSATNSARNMIEGNQCISYSGPGPSPCPNLPSGDVATILTGANAPSATGVSFVPSAVNAGGSFTATFSGSNLSATTYFDVRFRMPGSTTDLIALNWQRGTSAAHVLAIGTSAGTWIVTGVRAHTDSRDAAGPFTPVSVTLSVVP